MEPTVVNKVAGLREQSCCPCGGPVVNISDFHPCTTGQNGRNCKQSAQESLPRCSRHTSERNRIPFGLRSRCSRYHLKCSQPTVLLRRGWPRRRRLPRRCPRVTW